MPSVRTYPANEKTKKQKKTKNKTTTENKQNIKKKTKQKAIQDKTKSKIYPSIFSLQLSDLRK